MPISAFTAGAGVCRLIDGGTVRLPRIVGQGRALEIILTGRKVPAEECLRIGLCEYLVPNGEVRAKAEELAQRYCVAFHPYASGRTGAPQSKATDFRFAMD